MITQLTAEFLKLKPKPDSFSNELKEFIMILANEYDYANYSLKQIFYLLKNNFTSIPLCTLENCDLPRVFNKQNILTSGCCAEHTRKINNLKKYGVDNPAKLAYIKNRIKDTNILKYGVEYPMQSNDIKEKFKKTSLEKFGFENPSQNVHIQTKVESTNIKKFGVRRPIQNEEIFKKMTQTNLNKYKTETITGSNHFIAKSMELYGFENPMQNSNIRKKAEETNIKKYGGISPNSCATIFEKQQKACYRRKEYKWKTGEVSIVQGFEPDVLHELESIGYCFNDIITENSKMPAIWYVFKDKKARYYPDFYIPKENLIIEVKSQYTLDVQLDKNQAKFNAVKDNGFNFKLIIK